MSNKPIEIEVEIIEGNDEIYVMTPHGLVVLSHDDLENDEEINDD